MLYHLSLMDIGHRPPFPADSGLYAGVPESSGDCLAIVSVVRLKGGSADVSRRDRRRGGVSSGQQDDGRRRRVWRQLADSDIRNLSWNVEITGSTGRDLFVACGSFGNLPDGKEDVQEVYASLRTISGGGISAERLYILTKKRRRIISG